MENHLTPLAAVCQWIFYFSRDFFQIGIVIATQGWHHQAATYPFIPGELP
jgi:hypothetical protein